MRSLLFLFLVVLISAVWSRDEVNRHRRSQPRDVEDMIFEFQIEKKIWTPENLRYLLFTPAEDFEPEKLDLEEGTLQVALDSEQIIRGEVLRAVKRLKDIVETDNRGFVENTLDLVFKTGYLFGKLNQTTVALQASKDSGYVDLAGTVYVVVDYFTSFYPKETYNFVNRLVHMMARAGSLKDYRELQEFISKIQRLFSVFPSDFYGRLVKILNANTIEKSHPNHTGIFEGTLDDLVSRLYIYELDDPISIYSD